MRLVFYYQSCNYFFTKDGVYTCDNPGYMGTSRWVIEENKLYFKHELMGGMNWCGWDSKFPDQAGHDACVQLIRAWINDDLEEIILGGTSGI